MAKIIDTRPDWLKKAEEINARNFKAGVKGSANTANTNDGKTTPDFGKMSNAKLLEYGKEHGIELDENMTKAEMIEKLSASVQE